MMLYRNTKGIVNSHNGDTNFLDIVTGVFQVDRLTPFPFVICLDYELQTSIDLIKEWLNTKKKKQEANNILQKL